MNSRAFVPAVLWLVAVSGAALAEPRRQKLPRWDKFDEEDGISLFRREVPGSDVVALRAESVVDAPILRVGSVLTDTERATEWNRSLKATRIVRRLSDTEYVRWDHVKGPFFFDRDFVLKVKVELKRKDRQMVVSFHSVKDPDAPRTHHVRGELIYGTYVLTSTDGGTKTRVSVELLCDPRSSLKTWMAHKFQRHLAVGALSGLRRRVGNPSVPVDPSFVALLAREGMS
jgi:hypothetical protein